MNVIMGKLTLRGTRGEREREREREREEEKSCEYDGGQTRTAHGQKRGIINLVVHGSGLPPVLIAYVPAPLTEMRFSARPRLMWKHSTTRKGCLLSKKYCWIFLTNFEIPLGRGLNP